MGEQQGRLSPTDADEWREFLDEQLGYCDADEYDYNQNGTHIPFSDYFELFKDEWARVNCGEQWKPYSYGNAV